MAASVVASLVAEQSDIEVVAEGSEVVERPDIANSGVAALGAAYTVAYRGAEPVVMGLLEVLLA